MGVYLFEDFGSTFMYETGILVLSWLMLALVPLHNS